MTNAAGMVVSRCEAATLHRRFLAERADRYTPETFAQLDEAARLPAGLYLAAQRLREAFRLAWCASSSACTPSPCPRRSVTAPRVRGGRALPARPVAQLHPVELHRRARRLGALRPLGGGLPIGLQLVAPAFEDARLVALGSAVEIARSVEGGAGHAGVLVNDPAPVRRAILRRIRCESSGFSAPCCRGGLLAGGQAAAQSRGDTLIVVVESGPNSMDIHGVGTNRPAYQASWNIYDRLMTFGVKTLPDGIADVRLHDASSPSWPRAGSSRPTACR